MSKEDIMERYLNTVFFGNNAYGIQAAAETYFGKTAARPRLPRGGVPRRPGPFAVGLRPDQRTRAQPCPLDPGARPAGDRGDPRPRTRPSSSRTTFVLPERVQGDSRTVRTARTLLHRGAARLPAEPLRHPRRHSRAAVQPAVPRRSADPHHARRRACRQAAEQARDAASRHRRGVRRRDRVARLAVRRDPGDGRRTWVRAERTRAEHGARAHARPGRASSTSSSRRRSRPGAQAGDQIDGRRGCALAERRSERADLPDQRRRRRSTSATCADITARSINCGFARLSQIVGLNRVVDTTYRMAVVALPLHGASPTSEREPIEAVRQLRHRSERDDGARHGGRDPDPRQRRRPPRAVLRRVHRRCRRRAHSTPTSTRAPQVLDRDVGARDRRHHEGYHHRAAPVDARRRSPTAARRSARPAPRRTTPTPGSWAGRSNCRPRCGSATPTPTPR